jgi:hypothetical protein
MEGGDGRDGLYKEIRIEGSDKEWSGGLRNIISIVCLVFCSIRDKSSILVGTLRFFRSYGIFRQLLL